MKKGTVIAVCKNVKPGIPKHSRESIRLIDNYGIEGDYHAGRTIRHRYLARKDPKRSNNRQALIVDSKTISEIAAQGVVVKPGQLGENLLITNIGLMQLPIGTVLQIGEVEIQLTEIRQPCDQLNAIHPHLMDIVMPNKDDPSTYNAGMLGIITKGGSITVTDEIVVNT